MSAVQIGEWFSEGRKAFAAGHKLYGVESTRAPKKKFRSAWRDGWRAAREDARSAA